MYLHIYFVIKVGSCYIWFYNWYFFLITNHEYLSSLMFMELANLLNGCIVFHCMEVPDFCTPYGHIHMVIPPASQNQPSKAQNYNLYSKL